MSDDKHVRNKEERDLQCTIEGPGSEVLQHQGRTLLLVLHAQQVLGHVRLVLGALNDEPQQEIGRTEWHGDICQSDRLFVRTSEHHLVEQRAVEFLFLADVVLAENRVEKALVFGTNVIYGLESQETVAGAH